MALKTSITCLDTCSGSKSSKKQPTKGQSTTAHTAVQKDVSSKAPDSSQRDSTRRTVHTTG